MVFAALIAQVLFSSLVLDPAFRFAPAAAIEGAKYADVV
jgi:hypothetical protein